MVGKKHPPQSGSWLIDKSEIAQGFRLLGVLGVLDQQHAIGSIHIALGRAHGLLNAFDLVAVSFPYLGGVNACHQPTVPIPQPSVTWLWCEARAALSRWTFFALGLPECLTAVWNPVDGFRMVAVEIHKTRVQAAQTLVSLERTRIWAGGEAIRAFVATLNAETSKMELNKARAQGEAIKQDAYKSQVQAYSAFASAQAERARVAIARAQAKIAAMGREWDGWKARLSAEVAKIDAAVKQSATLVDGYRVSSTAIEAKAASFMRR